VQDEKAELQMRTTNSVSACGYDSLQTITQDMA
jgi:hypothetical protein